MKRAVLSALVVAAAVFFAASSAYTQDKPADAKGGEKTAEPGEKPVDLPEGIVARVNGQDITKMALMERCMELVGPKVLWQIIYETVVEQAARKHKVTITEKDVDQKIAKIKKTKFAEVPVETRDAALEQLLARKRMTMKSFRKQLEMRLTILAVVSKEIKITDEELRKEFDSRHGAKREISHIQVATEEAAKDALNRIRKKGDSFEKMAGIVSTDESSADNGGRLPVPVTRGRGLLEEFEKAAFSLAKVGDMTGVVKTPYGYHIIRLDKKIPPDGVKFEDVKAKLAEELRLARAAKQANVYMEQLRKDAKIDIDFPQD